MSRRERADALPPRASRVQKAKVALHSRIQQHKERWFRLTTREDIRRIVSVGLTYELKLTPKARKQGPHFCGTADQNADLLRHIEAWLDAGTIEPTSMSEVDIISLIFPVAKSDGSNRWCLDLRHFNKYLIEHRFKLTGIDSARQWLEPGDYCAVIDLKSAYESVMLARPMRRYMAFRAPNRRLYRYVVQTFGASASPYMFTELMKPVVEQLHNWGIRCQWYLDDGLIAARSADELRVAVARTIRFLHALGFQVNTDKSQMRPSQRVRYLGLELCTAAERFSLAAPRDKLSDLRRQARKVLVAHHDGSLTVRKLARLNGKLTALMPAMPAAAFRRHALDRCVQYGLRAAAARDGRPLLQYNTASASVDYDVPVSLSRTALLSVRWLTHASRRTAQCWQPMRAPAPRATLTTDASPTGYGAVLQIGARRLKLARFWSRTEASKSQNWRELTGLVRSFQHWLPLLKAAKIVRIRTDNTTALSCVRRLGSRHRHLGRAVEPLVRSVLRHRMHVQAYHVPGVLNTAADRLSRLAPDSNEWGVRQAALDKVCRSLGVTLEIDWMASSDNAKCDAYCSWHADVGARCTNAFAWDWADRIGYWCPPINLIPRVLGKIAAEGASGVVVVPWWPTQPWFEALRQRAKAWRHLPATAFVAPASGHPLRDGRAPPLTAFWL